MLVLAKLAVEQARSLRLARESEKQKRKVNLGPGALQWLSSQGGWVANTFPLNHFSDAAATKAEMCPQPHRGSERWAEGKYRGGAVGTGLKRVLILASFANHFFF